MIVRAIDEASADRGFEVPPFPPSDLRRPATSVLGTAVSEDVRACGLEVITTEIEVNAAFNAVEGRRSPPDPAAIRDIEDQLWGRLESVIDQRDIEVEPTDGQFLSREVEAAARVWDATFIVTARQEDVEKCVDRWHEGPSVVTMRAWLLIADQEIRRRRSDS